MRSTKRLAIPAALALATLATLAPGCGPDCPNPPPCTSEFVQDPDGGLIVLARYTDGAVTDGSCPPLPSNCPVA